MSARLLLCGALLLLPAPAPAAAWRSDTVKAWARALGEELWGLNEALTKADQIKATYKQMNASVKRKDGTQILESSLRSVGTMLTKKINAVKCIHAMAKQLAQDVNMTGVDDFQYCSSKYSNFTDATLDPLDTPEFAKQSKDYYMDLALEPDSHFYNISVNTNISCVHVPTNIYFKEAEAKKAILWSKGLNEIFIKNYEADPSLVWQYFGSAHGILRLFPAMPWNRMQKADIYDCRVQSWYIEAATCSKDVIILFDVSGSMTGFKNYVARTTLSTLLDTLSNNDYVNVYTFKQEIKNVLECFAGLVQATKENIETIKYLLEPLENGTHRIPLEGNANLTKAYMVAFDTLKERRQKTNCNVSNPMGCNQLVMVITDYVPGNLSEVFEEKNRETVDNQTYIPVRVFTYLIGKEVTNVEEIKSMACSNRGFFVHIHSVEEVTQQVLKYINVIARPMILDGSEPPPTWTHASIDATRTKFWNISNDVNTHDEDKLVTSVAIPAFHTIKNDDAILLGVAGTDVPIDSIAKLAQPHQLGVNGYSFIVSNNGYLLLHPFLKTSINAELQVNYNSVDFVEVEQVDDGKRDRELGPEILELREHLVQGDDGSMPGVKVLYHYDDMRRISRVKHNYYFNKLEGTPFSMGISLPDGYGDTELSLNDNPLEATQGKYLTGINVTDYFRYSFRIHPDWVYCKYHYLEGHESENPEIEIWKFLVNISKNQTDITRKQYTKESHKNFSVETHCGDARTKLETEDYYCNEDLVKQLVFDAKLTTPYFRNWTDRTDAEADLAAKYGVSVRFIMTSSGFTRWHYLYDDTKNEIVDDEGYRIRNYTGDSKVFGDKYSTTIEVTPYKAAVLQSMIERESVVVATPLPVLDKMILDKPSVIDEHGDITLTTTFAISYKDNITTPASVVGFQFSYLHFRDRFLEITSNKKYNDLSCNNSAFDCYVVDSSGYVVLSMVTDEVGMFFGKIHPLVMRSFLDKKVFEHVEVFNYQALCDEYIKESQPSSSWMLTTPFNLLKWFLVEFSLILSDAFKWNLAYAEEALMEEVLETTTTPPLEQNETLEAKEGSQKPFSCDHSINLYILKPMEASPVIFEEESGECKASYWASYVKHTNLLMVVVERGEPFADECIKIKKPPSTDPKPTINSTTSADPCHKMPLGKLKRRRLEGCFTYNEREANLTDCGRGNTAVPSARVVVLAAVASAAMASMLH